MPRHRPHPNRMQRIAASLALWSMLWMAFLPLLHHPAVFAGAAIPAAMPQDMAMCPMASMADTGPARPAHDPEKTKPACPICQSLAAMAHNYAPPVFAALTAPLIIETPVAAVAEIAAAYEPATAAWPRAPPSFA